MGGVKIVNFVVTLGGFTCSLPPYALRPRRRYHASHSLDTT
jgi:hypothetical protein